MTHYQTKLNITLSSHSAVFLHQYLPSSIYPVRELFSFFEISPATDFVVRSRKNANKFNRTVVPHPSGEH